MKDDLLILNALGRRDLPRILPVMLIIDAAAAFLLIRNGGLWVSFGSSGSGGTEVLQGMDAPRILFTLFIAELLYACMILRGSSSGKSRYRYTVGMLRISERRAFMLCGLFNILVYLLIWALLCCVVIIIGRPLQAAGAFGASPQGLYAGYLLDGCTQYFVPMDNAAVTVSTILLMTGLGLLSAYEFAGTMNGKAFPFVGIVMIIMIWNGLSFRAVDTQVPWVASSAIIFLVAAGMFWYRFSGLSRGTNVEVDDAE